MDQTVAVFEVLPVRMEWSFVAKWLSNLGNKSAPETNLRGARKNIRTPPNIYKNEPLSLPRSDQVFVENRLKIMSESVLERLGGLEA